MKKFIFVLLIAVGAAAAVGIDILFLVRGIEEVVRGFSAHPHSGHDIAWGIVNILWRDVIASAAFFLYAMILTALFWGRALRKQATTFNW